MKRLVAVVTTGGLAAWALLGCRDAQAEAPARYADMTDDAVSRAISDAHKEPDLGRRIQRVTEPFLGTPYVLGNMGEGPDGDGRDTDPRYNVKSTDCTTFVEHAIAFATSEDLAQARQRLDAVRYVKGRVGYGTRRHWPDAQWIPGLIQEGFVEEATQSVAGPRGKVETTSVTLDVPTFKASAHAAGMPLHDDEIPVGTFSLPYLPLRDAVAAAPRMEAGMVIDIVKAPKDGLLVRVSHQGLVVRKGKDVFIRNATSVGPKAVVDEPLATFVERQKQSKWTTVGFHFLRVKDR